MPGGASQGWPGLIFLSSYAFLSDAERESARVGAFNNILYGRLMLRHEVAHQWWGNNVLWEIYRDQWVVEALSNYSAMLLLEEDDPAAYRTAMDQLRSDLLHENAAGKPYKDAGPVTLGGRLSSSAFPDGFDVVSYGRGTWLLHMLRHMLRDASLNSAPRRARERRPAATPRDPDELFFRVLRDLRRDFEGKRISTADLQKAFEAVLPRSLWFEGRQSLDWFFEDWVNGVDVPKLELRNVRFSTQGGRALVTGKIHQSDAPERLVTSVPIFAATAGGPLLLGRVFADGEETSFRFTVPAGTKRLLLDPHHAVLRKP
jgi:aminopeptidase N